MFCLNLIILLNMILDVFFRENFYMRVYNFFFIIKFELYVRYSVYNFL